VSRRVASAARARGEGVVQGNCAAALDQHSWETELGERRSRVEVTADEIGASLRFATVEISKVERRSPDQADPTGGSDRDGMAEVLGADA
jgi:single-strand DNA-binding protein